MSEREDRSLSRRTFLGRAGAAASTLRVVSAVYRISTGVTKII